MSSAFNDPPTTSTTHDNISNSNLKANGQAVLLPLNKESLLINLKQECVNPDINSWIDYWYYFIGVNVLPANPREKKPPVGWAEWQDKPIPQSTLNEWKRKNMFKGIIIVPGKVWRGDHQGKYLIHIDLDKKRGNRCILHQSW